MTPTLTKVRTLKPDLRVVSGHSKGAVAAIRQINEQNIYVPMLAMTHWASADFIGIFGDAAENTLCASQRAPTLSYLDDLMGSVSDFAASFNERYGYQTPYLSAVAVMVFADAFSLWSDDCLGVKILLMSYRGRLKFGAAM